MIALSNELLVAYVSAASAVIAAIIAAASLRRVQLIKSQQDITLKKVESELNRKLIIFERRGEYEKEIISVMTEMIYILQQYRDELTKQIGNVIAGDNEEAAGQRLKLLLNNYNEKYGEFISKTAGRDKIGHAAKYQMLQGLDMIRRTEPDYSDQEASKLREIKAGLERSQREIGEELNLYLGKYIDAQ